jgi:transposase
VAALRELLRAGDRVVLEATTGSHHLAAVLERSGAQVFVADPQACRLVGMRGKKTDYRDCQALLRHLRAGELATVWRPDASTRQQRYWTREREAYNQTATRLKNRIRALLREEGYEAPVPLWTSAGSAWLDGLPLSPAVQAILARERRLLATVLREKAALEEELLTCALTTPAVPIVMQVVGIGPALAVMLLGELGEPRRFATGKKAASYAGLHPRVHSTDGQGPDGPISKAGRSALRWLLVEAAWAHVLHDGAEAWRYRKLVARGKKPAVAIVALARHLLVVLHALLTRDAAYRGVAPTPYLTKLRLLGQRRPAADRAQEPTRSWAERHYERVTHTAPPVPAPPAAGVPSGSAPEPAAAGAAPPQKVRRVAKSAEPPAPSKGARVASRSAGREGDVAREAVPR